MYAHSYVCAFCMRWFGHAQFLALLNNRKDLLLPKVPSSHSDRPQLPQFFGRTASLFVVVCPWLPPVLRPLPTSQYVDRAVPGLFAASSRPGGCWLISFLLGSHRPHSRQPDCVNPQRTPLGRSPSCLENTGQPGEGSYGLIKFNIGKEQVGGSAF